MDLPALGDHRGWLADRGRRWHRDAWFSAGALVTGLAARGTTAEAIRQFVRTRIGNAVVAATDDPCLESWLAFPRPAWAPCITPALARAVIHLDIGGGTTNSAFGVGGNRALHWLPLHRGPPFPVRGRAPGSSSACPHTGKRLLQRSAAICRSVPSCRPTHASGFSTGTLPASRRSSRATVPGSSTTLLVCMSRSPFAHPTSGHGCRRHLLRWRRCARLSHRVR